MSDERLTNLEARYAWLERHGVEQDKAMVEMGEELRRLRRQIEALHERLQAGDGADQAVLPEEPPPPHY